jgi:hypothetical protein
VAVRRTKFDRCPKRPASLRSLSELRLLPRKRAHLLKAFHWHVAAAENRRVLPGTTLSSTDGGSEAHRAAGLDDHFHLLRGNKYGASDLGLVTGSTLSTKRRISGKGQVAQLLDLDGIRNAVARAGQRNDASFSLSGSTPTTLRVQLLQQAHHDFAIVERGFADIKRAQCPRSEDPSLRSNLHRIVG